MTTHKNAGIHELTTPQLRSSRDALVAALPPADGRLTVTLVEQHRKCGKEGILCRRGEPHGPYVYLQVAGRLLYVQSGLEEVVRAHVADSEQLRGVLAEISAINLELLARRELE